MRGAYPTGGAPQAAATDFLGPSSIWGATYVLTATGIPGTISASHVVAAPVGRYDIVGRVDFPGQGYGGGAFFPVGGYPVGSDGVAAGNVTVGGLSVPLVITGRLGITSAAHVVAGTSGSLTYSGKTGQPQADVVTQRFNYILNNTTGAGWVGGTSQGVTASVQSSGWDEYGRYVEVRVSGTSTANWFINISPIVYANGLGIPTALGKSFTNSIGARLVSGTTPSNITLRSALRNAGGSYGGELGNAQAFQGRLSSERIEVIQSATITSELAVSTGAYIQFSTQLGVTYDLTLRIYDWQQEDGLTRTPVIYTDGSGIGVAGAPGGLVTSAGQAGITSAAATVVAGAPRQVTITPWAGTVAQGSVVEAPVRGVTISGFTSITSATSTVVAGVLPILVSGKSASTLSQNFISGLKGSLSWKGETGSISAQVTSIGLKGHVAAEGKAGTVQAGKTYPSLGNAFYPMGAYPMGASGAPPGSADINSLTGNLLWTPKSGSAHASSVSSPPVGTLTAVGKAGSVTASVVVLAPANQTVITGLTGEESASVQVLAPVVNVVITPRLGTGHASSTSTGFKGTVTIFGYIGQVEASDSVSSGPPGHVAIVGREPTVISNNHIPAKTGSAMIRGRIATVAIANRRRHGRLVTALKS